MTGSRHKRLKSGFYQRDDVLQISRELLGMILVTDRSGIRTSGRIVEVEAYAGTGDRASHAFGGRRTPRNEPMYQDGGQAYVYLCYGIHHLFNVVTNRTGIPHAILIRGIEPLEGISDMLNRTGKKQLDHTLTRGPGNLSRALGLSSIDSRTPLTGSGIYLADDGFRFPDALIAASPRIGVAYAGEDALLPYRFYVRGNPYVSGKPG